MFRIKPHEIYTIFNKMSQKFIINIYLYLKIILNNVKNF